MPGIVAGSGKDVEGVVDVGVVPGISVTGVGIVSGTTIGSEPIGAKGLGRPSLPSGFNKILESFKDIKTGSEKIASSNFKLLIFKRIERKSWVIKEACPGVIVPVGVVAETRLASSGAPLKKYIYPRISRVAITEKIIMFLKVGDMLIF